MTVAELIAELQKYPADAKVEAREKYLYGVVITGADDSHLATISTTDWVRSKFPAGDSRPISYVDEDANWWTVLCVENGDLIDYNRVLAKKGRRPTSIEPAKPTNVMPGSQFVPAQRWDTRRAPT